MAVHAMILVAAGMVAGSIASAAAIRRRHRSRQNAHRRDHG